jgi:hypothetical protein
MFTKGFGKFVSDGDRIETEVDGFRVVATAHYDDDTTPPYERQDGFWPSKDPKNAGYVLPGDYETQMAKAKRVMEAWEADEWHYFGVAVVVYKNDVKLTDTYAHALWGIEGNYPEGDANEYMMTVANDLLPDAIEDAKKKIAELAEPEEKLRSALKTIAWVADGGRQFNPGTEAVMRDLFVNIRDMALRALNQ